MYFDYKLIAVIIWFYYSHTSFRSIKSSFHLHFQSISSVTSSEKKNNLQYFTHVCLFFAWTTYQYVNRSDWLWNNILWVWCFFLVSYWSSNLLAIYAFYIRDDVKKNVIFKYVFLMCYVKSNCNQGWTSVRHMIVIKLFNEEDFYLFSWVFLLYLYN